MSWLGALLAVGGVVAVNWDLRRRGPFFMFDVYAHDQGPAPDFAASAAHSQWCGGVLKATQGTREIDGGWFVRNWPRLRAAGGARYGRDWFRGAYCYLALMGDGKAQGAHYVRTLERAGGFDVGDIVPIVDVERGGETSSNREASAERIIECTSAWAAEVKRLTGQRVMLYGRGAMRDLGIGSRMGCDQVWNPAWTSTMVTNGLVEVDGKPGPWTLDDIALWQYCGDGVAAHPTFPRAVPGMSGGTDINVFVDGTRATSLARMQERLLVRAEALR